MKIADCDIAHLPGAAVVQQGVGDLKAGRRTPAACLVQIARTRLARAGLSFGANTSGELSPERDLYRLLRAQGGDAYSRYNALLRELGSFCQALDALHSRHHHNPSE